jgi:hypothetical protein
MAGITNIKRSLQKGFTYIQRNFMPETGKKVPHIYISPMEKYNRQLLIITGKNRVLPKSSIRKEI